MMKFANLFPVMIVAFSFSCKKSESGQTSSNKEARQSASATCSCLVDTATSNVYLDSKCKGELLDLDVSERHRYDFPKDSGVACRDMRTYTIYQKYSTGDCSAKTYIGLKDCK